jgi:hypothetical protein
MSVIEGYKGYREGEDITQISSQYLSYPSKNCLVYKGKALVRGGIKNDGNEPVGNKRIHSEYVWKKAPSGAKALRVCGQDLQVKLNGTWVTIFSGFSANTTRVRFASWVDTTGTIIKSRLFMVDGSENIYEWNGAVGVIASSVGANVVISGNKTLLQNGFEAGNVTPQNVKIVRLAAGNPPTLEGVEDYIYTDSLSGGNNVTLGTDASPSPDVNDYIVASVVTHTTILTGFSKDEIYNYKNKLFVANLGSGRIYYSHVVNKLDFVIPGTKTAITPDLLDLDGNFTAIISRKNILWISTEDDWFKVTITEEVNAYGFWTTVEKFEQAESTGSKPYAVAIQKGDIIFMAQDKSLRRITSLEIIGTDDIQLISEGVDAMFLRFELDDVRLYYHQRYIFIISSNEGVMFMLDTIQNEFQPPQFLPITCMSIIEGVRYGHHNARNETYYLFEGRNDLGADIEAVMAFGYLSGKNPFRYMKHQIFGIHARGTKLTKVRVDHYYEESGAKASTFSEFIVKDIKVYEVPDDVSFGAQAFATRSLAGIDDVTEEPLKPFYLFDKWNAISYFNYRPVFTIYGSDVGFHLIGWYVEDESSDRKIGSDLFIPRGE